MFEDALMENVQKGTSRWSVILSTVLQLFLVGVFLLIPLINYYELPDADFVSFLTAPPPPPPPPPPPAAVVVKAGSQGIRQRRAHAAGRHSRQGRHHRRGHRRA